MDPTIPAYREHTKLLVIDTKTLMVKRVVKGKCTDRARLTPPFTYKLMADLEAFRLNGTPEARA